MSVDCSSLKLNPAEAPEEIDRPIHTILSGKIQRITLSPAIQSQIASTKTSSKQATLYAKSSVWYDALTILGNQLQAANSKDPEIATAWAELLQQVDLKASASVPFTIIRPQSNSR